MNPHHEAAQEHLAHAATVPLIHQEIAATQALAEAQLSNAWEQRTQNLIRLAHLEHQDNPKATLSEYFHELNIYERLGIE